LEYRALGRTGFSVSAVSLGTWAMGGSWGKVDDRQSLAALNRAVDLGINFFDTADVYGDGRAERLLGELKRCRKEEIFIATKAGRRLNPHNAQGYNYTNLKLFIERSLTNLRVDSIDLLQLHCPPTQVYTNPEVYEALDKLVQQGKILHYGVSVEKISEALEAIDHPNVETVQIIFNIFRPRPAEKFFSEAINRRIGVLTRVPLASGLLTGKLTPQSTFAADDHRNYNRNGTAFDQGETFSGVEFKDGLNAVEELRPLVSEGVTMAQLALRWILMFQAVSCVIPGAKNIDQVEENLGALALGPLSNSTMANITAIYSKYFRSKVHERW
jgi:aryl-alcohol dehydrogenase-like predicted oxidoreductase